MMPMVVLGGKMKRVKYNCKRSRHRKIKKSSSRILEMMGKMSQQMPVIPTNLLKLNAKNVIKLGYQGCIRN